MKIHTEPDLHWYMDFFDQPMIFLMTEMPAINMMSQECVDKKSGHCQGQTSS